MSKIVKEEARRSEKAGRRAEGAEPFFYYL